jgi:hypothetical protein
MYGAKLGNWLRKIRKVVKDEGTERKIFVGFQRIFLLVVRHELKLKTFVP